MDAGGTAGRVNRVQARELLLLVIGEADAVHAEQVHHLAQVCFEVLGRLAHLGHPHGYEPAFQLFRGAVELRRGVHGGRVAQRHLRRLDCFHREGSADARDLAVYFGLVHQFFLVGVCGDAGVDLVHRGAPRRAVLFDGFLQIGGVIRIGVKRDFPMLPALALGREFPSVTVGLGDGLLAFLLLLQCELRTQLVAEPVRHGLERFIGGCKTLFEGRCMFRENRIEVRILRDCPQHHVRNSSVPESLCHARRFVSKFEVFVPGREDALPS